MPVELVTYIIQNLVSEPDKLAFNVDRDVKGIRIEISCAPQDTGRIIGRGGRIINSIRTLARAAADGREQVEIHVLDA